MKQKGLCRALLLILFATCAVAGQAQEVLRSDSVTGVDAGKESLKIQPSASEVTPEKVGARLALTDTLVTDTAQWTFRPSLPPLYRNGTVAYFPASYYGGYWGLWELHEGFNACLDMSVSASFGKNRFPGVGFGTGISAMYVRSLTDRLVLSVGGFYDRLSWNGLNENRFGINLLAGYQLTDRVSLYAYGSKAFFPDARSSAVDSSDAVDEQFQQSVWRNGAFQGLRCRVCFAQCGRDQLETLTGKRR